MSSVEEVRNRTLDMLDDIYEIVLEYESQHYTDKFKTHDIYGVVKDAIFDIKYAITQATNNIETYAK